MKIGWGYVWGLLEWILTRIHSPALPQVPQAPFRPLSPDAKDSTHVINRFPPETPEAVKNRQEEPARTLEAPSSLALFPLRTPCKEATESINSLQQELKPRDYLGDLTFLSALLFPSHQPAVYDRGPADEALGVPHIELRRPGTD